MIESSAQTSPSADRRHRFVTNVLWNWLGLAFNLCTGLLLSPYIVRKLGAEGYGVWQLVFSFLGYSLFLDMGLRSAVVRFSAMYRAQNDSASLNELLSTVLTYFSIAGAGLVGLSLILAQFTDRIFHVSPQFSDELPILVVLVGINFAFSITVNVFNGAVEGFQRFDISGRIRVLTFGMRSGGHALLLALGFGLIPMATWTLLMNFQFCILFYASLRRIYPGLHLSYHLAHVRAWRNAAHYGVHSLLAGISAQLLDQTAPVVIGLFRPAEYVGYFSLPARLMQYTSELVSRVGPVAAPQAAELAAKHRMDRVIRLSMYANRYCLSIFSPMAIVLFVWGRELMRAWVNEEFSAQSADVLPVLVLGTAMVLAQGTSGSVLFGLGKHQGYAFTLLSEAIGSSLMMLFIVPKFGIIGAAWVSATWMMLARGLWVPHLVCKQLGCHYPAYMASIYTRPVLIGLPVCGLAMLLKQRLFPGDNLMQLAMAGTIVALVYVLIALRVSVEPEHRAVLVRWLEHHGILPDRGT